MSAQSPRSGWQSLAASATALLLLAAVPVNAADTAPSTLYSFGGTGDGAYPQAVLVQGSDGNFYGTTAYGGKGFALDGSGTVFQMTASGALTTLHAFAKDGSEGYEPAPALMQAGDGAFYGTTAGGGSKDDGTVFKITTAGALTTLYTFTGGSDGLSPNSLTLAGDGTLYGTTALGGSGGYGTIFRITTAGALTTLHAFTGGADGAAPAAPPVQGADGNFYGTTAYGGKNTAYAGYGTAYQITASGTFNTLHTFDGGAEGSYPAAPLTQGIDGSFYGTAPLGAGGSNRGTAFRITAAGVFTTLHTFTGGTDGDGPYGGLVQAADGTLYGTTYRDGLAVGTGSSDGTIFSLTTSGVLTTLYTFNAATAGNPFAPHGRLLLTEDANLYGTAVNGGTSDHGAIFRLAVSSGASSGETAGTLAFNATAYSATEASGSATVTVTRTGGGKGAVSVAYAAAAGTAVDGTDFTATSGTLSWADGDTAGKTFTVTILENPASTADHTVALSLGATSGGAVLGVNTTATLTIADVSSPAATATVNISVAGSTSLVKGEKTKVLFVRSGGDTSSELTVAYKVKGTAVNGTDYASGGQPLSGSITISAGAVSAKIKIKDLGASEVAKKIKLSLQASASNAYTVGSANKVKISLAAP